MSILPARKPLPPVEVEWSWQHPPAYPTPRAPEGFAGLLTISALRSTGKWVTESYMVTPYILPGTLQVNGWRLQKDDDTHHDIDDVHWTCSCADAIFNAERPGSCKHVKVFREALAEVPVPDERDDYDAPPGHDNRICF
jgi:hypothetical protein